MSESDEDSLFIQRISQGDEHALILLMERYKEPIFRFVYRYLGNESDCSEITEETFFKVYQKAHSYTPRATVKTWIFSIALNLSRDRLRRQKKFRGQVSLHAPTYEGQSEDILLESVDSGSADPHSALHTSDTIRLIKNQIQKLPDKLKFPFVFCVLEDHSYDECAAILKINRKTVDTRIYRARQVLREALSSVNPKT